jgi:hypothetical protein
MGNADTWCLVGQAFEPEVICNMFLALEGVCADGLSVLRPPAK